MAEIIKFVPKSERERIRLIREARAIYDSIFPPADPATIADHAAPADQTRSIADPRRGDGAVA